MLLAGMGNSISKEKIQGGLAVIKLDSMDKQGFYFGILEILKNISDHKLAATQIIEAVESLVATKAIEAHEVIFDDSGTSNKTESLGPSKQSPIFRRVG